MRSRSGSTLTKLAIWLGFGMATLSGGAAPAAAAPHETGRAMDHASFARSLSLDDRIKAQESIERVYWAHRIWPKENRTPKPSFETAMPASVIRARVLDSLKKSQALETIWRRPVSSGQLQAEIDRMISGTRSPQILQELFAALDNDPLFIAETLARQTLVDRLVRSFYARDGRFHDALRHEAESEISHLVPESKRRAIPGAVASEMRKIPERYSETTYSCATPRADAPGTSVERQPQPLQLDCEELRAIGDSLVGTSHPTRDVPDPRGHGPERRHSWAMDPFGARSGFPLPGQRDGSTGAGSIRDTIESPGDVRPSHGTPLEIGTRATPDSERASGALELREDDESFYVVEILEKSNDILKVASLRWPKVGFDTWWRSPSSSIEEATPAAAPRGLRGYTIKPLPSGDTCADDTWEPTRQDGPETRSRHTSVWTGTEMIVWGGSHQFEVSDQGFRYNAATDTWTRTSRLGAPTPRADHTAVWTGTEMIVWGGHTNSVDEYYLGTGGRYDPASDTWTATSDTGSPSKRYGHSAVWTGTEMVVWGGLFEECDLYRCRTPSLSSGGRYDPNTDRWIATSLDGAPSPRSDHLAVWTGTEMIVWGGSNNEYPFTIFDTGGRYNPIDDTWTATSLEGAPTPRFGSTAVWTGNEMIVWGGYLHFVRPEEGSTGARYDPEHDVWTPTSILGAPGPRLRHSALWTGSEMIVWGGTDLGRDTTFRTGGRYDPQTDRWAPMNLSGAPSGRVEHTAVWTGSEMIVWGGYTDLIPGVYSDIQVLNTGGRYDPESDSWFPTNTGSMPDSRSLHTAVWTGAEMIVWGGYRDGGTQLATGSRYSPATDSWSPTSSAGAPEERMLHSAVWTGSDMIVWGGWGRGGAPNPLNTGAVYNPTFDLWWRPTSLANAPVPRWDHTAVWSGREMIVWGGRTSYGVIVETGVAGKRYDFESDQWADVTSIGAPSGRVEHVAVWTGSEMIVWGGAVFSGQTHSALDTGGRYNPEADAWAETSLTGAPSPRQGHTAVWTSTEMIVWGGGGSQYFDPVLNTGGRYNPRTNTWRETRTLTAPIARDGHTAVWTGTEMIVWGGHLQTVLGQFLENFTNTGGRYRPASDTWSPTTTLGAPDGRTDRTAVWGQGKMTVWGGFPETSSGGRYCAVCAGSATLYADTDGDGYGNGAELIHTDCDQPLPSGYVDVGTDCNDSDPSIHPGAADSVCDRIDDNCNGVTDDEACSDGNPCTDDTCDESGVGCVHTDNAAPCEDGVTCNGHEVCGGGTCNAGAPVICDDGFACTLEHCNEITGRCDREAFDALCDDSNPCTEDYCDESTGCYFDEVYCDDDDGCTSDSCNPATGCVFKSIYCDDGVFCNGQEECKDGYCYADPPCDDLVPCTLDSCDEERHECTHAPQECDDLVFCNGKEFCDLAYGCRAPDAACEDHDACTFDVCNEASKSCTHTPLECDDHLFCNGQESCDPAAGCMAGASPFDDGIPCTMDTCDEELDVANHTPIDLACDDGNPCTIDVCNAETGCVRTNTTSACEDGNACTTQDTCVDGACIGGAPLSCDDGFACTTDRCNRTSGCRHFPDAGACDDGNSCTIDLCVPATGCQHVASTDACDDGDACTTNDLCEDGGCRSGPMNCADSRCSGDPRCATNAPPVCSSAHPTPTELWPPNARMETISLEGVTDPDGDDLSITITGIRQDEPPLGHSAGHPCPDASGIGTPRASLRAERSGTGDGRVYHVSFRASDGHEGTCTGVALVCVPHDHGPGFACGDGGSLYDSTRGCGDVKGGGPGEGP